VSRFELLPAIDLQGGRVVRLRQGDFDRETAYADDPVAVAHRFADAGARWIHAVDLDGARAGEPRQGQALRRLVESVDGVSFEIAGGLRSEAAVASAIDVGARRVVVGTAALGDPTFAGGIVRRYGTDRIAVALDVRDGFAVGEGWREGAAGVPAVEALVRLADVGVTIFEVTAIERDGLLEGPDVSLLRRLVGTAADRGRIIASGGIASVADLLAVRDLGCAGAIVGRAIYDGAIELAGALAALNAEFHGSPRQAG